MQIIVRSRGLDLSEEFHDYAVRRLRFALGRREQNIARVVVTVSDLNGPRGGADKSCRIAAQVAGVGQVVVLERGFAAAVCLDRAAQRLAYRIARLLDRAQMHSSESPRFQPAAG